MNTYLKILNNIEPHLRETDMMFLIQLFTSCVLIIFITFFVMFFYFSMNYEKKYKEEEENYSEWIQLRREEIKKLEKESREEKDDII